MFIFYFLSKEELLRQYLSLFFIQYILVIFYPFPQLLPDPPHFSMLPILGTFYIQH